MRKLLIYVLKPFLYSFKNGESVLRVVFNFFAKSSNVTGSKKPFSCSKLFNPSNNRWSVADSTRVLSSCCCVSRNSISFSTTLSVSATSILVVLVFSITLTVSNDFSISTTPLSVISLFLIVVISVSSIIWLCSFSFNLCFLLFFQNKKAAIINKTPPKTLIHKLYLLTNFCHCDVIFLFSKSWCKMLVILCCSFSNCWFNAIRLLVAFNCSWGWLVSL